MSRKERSAAAYRHVDVSKIPEEARGEILADADAGGREFGLRVVEIAHNGPAQTPIYGVYKQDEETWLETKVDFGIEEDGDVDMTAKAEAEAAEAAAKMKAAEDAELEKISGGKKK